MDDVTQWAVGNYWRGLEDRLTLLAGVILRHHFGDEGIVSDDVQQWIDAHAKVAAKAATEAAVAQLVERLSPAMATGPEARPAD
jgi:hypothetical protein